MSLQWALWSVRGLFNTGNSASLNVICIQTPARQELLQLSWSPVRGVGPLRSSAVTPAGHESWLAGSWWARPLQWSWKITDACIWHLLQAAAAVHAQRPRRSHYAAAGSMQCTQAMLGQPSQATKLSSLQLLYPYSSRVLWWCMRSDLQVQHAPQ